MQGHFVHVVGVGSAWGRELPGIVEGKGERGGSGDGSSSEGGVKGGKMKIAYRYERLGVLGEGTGVGSRGAFCLLCVFHGEYQFFFFFTQLLCSVHCECE